MEDSRKFSAKSFSTCKSPDECYHSWSKKCTHGIEEWNSTLACSHVAESYRSWDVPTEGFFLMDGGCHFVTIPCNLGVKERQRTIFLFFNSESNVWMAWVHVKNMSGVFEHEENIINIPSIVQGFELHREVVQPLLKARKRLANVEPRGDPIATLSTWEW